jgi:hypothetical protein
MNTVDNLSPERIAEIMAFKTTDFSDCPVQTEEELKEFRPKHPENFRPGSRIISLTLDEDTANYLYSKAETERKTPAQIVSDLVREKVKAAV